MSLYIHILNNELRIYMPRFVLAAECTEMNKEPSQPLENIIVQEIKCNTKFAILMRGWGTRSHEFGAYFNSSVQEG